MRDKQLSGNRQSYIFRSYLHFIFLPVVPMTYYFFIRQTADSGQTGITVEYLHRGNGANSREYLKVRRKKLGIGNWELGIK